MIDVLEGVNFSYPGDLLSKIRLTSASFLLVSITILHGLMRQ